MGLEEAAKSLSECLLSYHGSFVVSRIHIGKPNTVVHIYNPRTAEHIAELTGEALPQQDERRERTTEWCGKSYCICAAFIG